MTISFIKNFFLLAILLFCLLQATQVHAQRQKYKIVIANGLPSDSPPLTAHCRSKDDDIGNHTLKVNEFFSWRFAMNFWGTTRFYCRFIWGRKTTFFDVFKKHLAFEHCGASTSYVNICYWLVKEDGFYLANTDYPKPSKLMFMHTWDGRS